MNTPTDYTRSDEFLADAIKAPSRIAAYVIRDLLTELQQRRAIDKTADRQTHADDSGESEPAAEIPIGELVCPNCGHGESLWSDETASIMYTVRLTGRDDGTVAVDYTGTGYDPVDESTTYEGRIWCRDCGSRLTEADLITAERDES